MTASRLDAFSAQGSSRAGSGVTGNTPWAVEVSAAMRKIAQHASDHAPRSLQVHLGPSEVGTACDRQVVGKLIGQPATNHVSDPWPSIVGTAFHAWIEQAVNAHAARTGEGWLTERRVNPDPTGRHDHSGTADLYRLEWQAVLDHKALGKTTHAKLVRQGPPRGYLVQILLYARGYRALGLPVERVAIIAWPRTGSTLAEVYTHAEELTPELEALADHVLQVELPYRHQLAAAVRDGALTIDDVPRAPDDADCYFCPFYRPQAAHDPSLPGCPGPRA